MPYELDRTGDSLASPSLAEMTDKAISALGYDEDGFVLMVEGGRIDHVCADTDPTGAVFETLSFNDAVQEAYDFYTKHPEETLIIVVGDHETGGLSLNDSLDIAHISGVKLSIPERLHLAYTDKDRKAYYEYLSKNFGLDDLNPSEKKRLDNALDFADSSKYKGDYTGSPASVVASIFSKRIGVKWVGKEHTGASVPLYAVGMRSEDF
jgi:alkaline phosphatase